MKRLNQGDLFKAGFIPDGKGGLKRGKHRAKPVRHEENMQLAVCQYLKEKHPLVLFQSDLASGMKLTMGQAVKAKKLRSDRAMPDMYIFRPSRGYHGLILELKASGTVIILKNGEMTEDKHVREQAEILKRFNEEGYHARFVIGLEEAVEIIQWYLSTD